MSQLANTLYTTYIRPLLKQNEKKIDALVDEATSAAKKKANDLVTKKGPEMIGQAIGAIG